MDVDKKEGKSRMEWDSGTIAVTRKTEKSWTLELQIPLKNLKIKPPQLGEIWGFNICRLRKTVKNGQYTCWSPTFGNFGNPERFGKLIFQ